MEDFGKTMEDFGKATEGFGNICGTFRYLLWRISVQAVVNIGTGMVNPGKSPFLKYIQKQLTELW